jgi:hypothetical protein
VALGDKSLNLQFFNKAGGLALVLLWLSSMPIHLVDLLAHSSVPRSTLPLKLNFMADDNGPEQKL